ncbi:hypothetical protein QUB31_35455 [Microcoleus sp. B13-B4]
MILHRKSTPKLRFPLVLHAKESIPGAIVRAARQHVLQDTSIILRAAAINVDKVGLTQLADRDALQRISQVIRCSPDDLFERSVYRTKPNDARSKLVRFGDFSSSRLIWQFDRRRIAPTTLTKSPYHRLEWQNLLLPYCPESFEKIIDTCDACSWPLGWRYTAGIELCEFCDQLVCPSDRPLLDEGCRAHYRLFADLVSPLPWQREQFRRGLPPTLIGSSPGDLSRLVLQLGGLVEDLASDGQLKSTLGLESQQLARIVATGIRLLLDWPESFQTWTQRQFLEVAPDQRHVGFLWRRLKDLASPHTGRRAFAGIIANALPELGKHHSIAWRTHQRIYDCNQAATRLGITPSRVVGLRNWDGLKCHKVRRTNKSYFWFDADQIDALSTIFENSVKFSTVTSQTHLPVYGVEALCKQGLLEWVGHPAVRNALPFESVTKASLEDLLEKLRTGALGGPAPSDAVSLRLNSRRIGGRLKPWGRIIEAMLNGLTPYWLIHSRASADSIVVRREHFDAYECVQDRMVLPDLPVQPFMNQIDIGEVLNAYPPVIQSSSSKLGIEFKKCGAALVAPREKVLQIAEQVAWHGEVMHHLDLNVFQVEDLLASADIPRIASGWCRSSLVNSGFLKSRQ